MPARRAGGGVNTKRRKHSLGNLRRAHPASGATWNVQVVRGKMSTKCLWHACRALILGLTLLLLGAGMATLGYYADHLSISSEIRGNATVRVKNDLKGFHLNNFSYVGPIVMGFGGFIVVASCVMTFEARDSAAKVVPARLRAGIGSKMTVRSNQSSSASQRRAIGMQLQNSRWDQQFGVFRSSPAAEAPQSTVMPFDRDALTAELVKFSKSLGTTRESATAAACSLLQPPSNASKLHWHAASFDESCRVVDKQRERVAERTKRSDTAKRHVLARQKPIEHDEDKDKISSSPLGNRRSSTMSDSSYSGRWTVRCSSLASRASSIDSRRIQVDLHSPEVMPKSILRSPKRYHSGPSTTPSVEKEFRSQLSVCSEPPAAIRQLSGQSSLEPCLPEEATELLDDNVQVTLTESVSILTSTTINPVDNPPSPSFPHQMKSPSRSGILKKPRPDSLPLLENATIVDLNKKSSNHERYKYLQRSNSSRTYDRPKSHKTVEHDDSVFYLRSEHRVLQHSTDFYDSEQVIKERRTTLLKADSETALGERKSSSLSIPEKILEQTTQSHLDIETPKSSDDTILQIELDVKRNQKNPPISMANEANV